MRTIRLKKNRTAIIVSTIMALAVGGFIAVASLPTVFWNVRPVWLNAKQLKAWHQQDEPLSEPQLRILLTILVDINDVQPQVYFSLTLDILHAHMHHQEDPIVKMLIPIAIHRPSMKMRILPMLYNVSPKHKPQVVTLLRAQLLNDDHGMRSTIIYISIDGLSKLDPIESRELIERFTKNSDSDIASYASYRLELIDERHSNEKTTQEIIQNIK